MSTNKETHDTNRFASAVNRQLGSGTTTWGGTNTEAVIMDLLVDRSGNPPKLEPDDRLLIKLASNPNVEIQFKILEQVRTRLGVSWDDEEQVNIRRILNPTAFRQELVDAEKLSATPKTKRRPLSELLG